MREFVSERRAGRQILTLKPGEEWHACVPAKGDHVAVIGQNRKLLVFPLAEVPEMPKGAGVQLQKYKDGGIADVKVFTLANGLTWRLGANTRTETRLTEWLGSRAQAGRLPPLKRVSEIRANSVTRPLEASPAPAGAVSR